ncbi:MAG: alpha-E domain-containing protein, partial [bacterium]
MLSGHAEAIYWLGRYVERAEDGARLANVHANLLLDLPRRYALGWAPLIAITGTSTLFAELYREPSERNVVRFLVADEKNPGSILSSLNAARYNARLLRDLL